MRAMSGEDEIILSVPRNKIEELMSGILKSKERRLTYIGNPRMMQHDFAQPPLYQRLFKRWGLYPDK